MRRFVFSLIVTIYFFAVSYIGRYYRETHQNIEPPANSVQLDSLWKYKQGDNQVWANNDFNDSSWDTTHTDLLPAAYRGEILWFRLHLKPNDFYKGRTVSLNIIHFGASDIFLDGHKVASFGVVSSVRESEKIFNPEPFPININLLNNDSHIVAVRYSNKHFAKFKDLLGEDFLGFQLSIVDDHFLQKRNIKRRYLYPFYISLGAVLLTLAGLHFLLYLFYRKAKENLYYSLFAFCYSMVFICGNVTTLSASIELALFCQKAFLLFLDPFLFLTLIAFVYWINERRFPWGGWLAVGVGAVGFLYVFTDLIGRNLYFVSLIWYAMFCVVIMARGTFIAIKEKRPGAKILAAGFGIFALFLFATITLIYFSSHLSLNLGSNNVFILITSLLALLSIPISMSVYLAYTSSSTNRSLQIKLAEVETLSAKTIEQEKEKQKILETQKETLEVQVKERTYEISEQKKMIEEKNKDITDSINYAKRIQDAILPAKEIKYRLFPEAFVLFKPKDIVSGDFYWFAEKNGKKIIAAVDCTGHGVPGAFMSSIGTNLLNNIVLTDGITKPSEILSALNAGVRFSLGQGAHGTETKDGMDIALITFNSEHDIEFAGAQRPLWIVNKKQNESGIAVSDLTEIKGDKFSIGGSPTEGQKIFTNHVLKLAKNDSIYIFSDGFADQFSSKDKKLMTRRFKEILMDIHHQPMLQQEKYLDEFIDKWRGNMEQTDDILVIGISMAGFS